MSAYDIEQLTRVGEKISLCMDVFFNVAQMLSDEDLDEFERYLGQQETVMPMLNPTAAACSGFLQIDEARERLKFVRAGIKILDKELASKEL